MIDGRPEFDSFCGGLGTGKLVALVSVLVGDEDDDDDDLDH